MSYIILPLKESILIHVYKINIAAIAVFIILFCLISLIYKIKPLIVNKNNNNNKRKPYKSLSTDPPDEPEAFEKLNINNWNKFNGRPWRPFRWPYHQTMAIFKLNVNNWLDIDKWYKRYIDDKFKIYLKTGHDYIDWLPGSEDSTLELLEIVSNHMCKRFPNLFKKKENGRYIHNLITNELLDLSKVNQFKSSKDSLNNEFNHPLYYVSKLAKEDFYIVQKNNIDNKHYLMAAAVPAPGGFFSVKDKIGKHLDIIHEPVPYYESKLKPSMERWFERMNPNDMVERASWFITWDHELTINNIFALNENENIPNNIDYKKYVIRVCKQTLRRLPRSKAIIFTNHPIFYSIEELKDEPGIPSILKQIILEAPEKIIKYKSFEKIVNHIIPYLDSLIKRQIDLGLISCDYQPKTSESYPFASWYDKTAPIPENGYHSPYMHENI